MGRLASEEVVMHLIKAKCLLVLLYGLDVCPVNLSDRPMRSLVEFTVKRVLIKLFRTYDNVTIDSCMASFRLATVSELVSKRKKRFLLKLNLQDNLLCTVCQ